MKKMVILLFILLLALSSLGVYLILTVKINAGNLKIAAGQIQLKQGEEMLASGKVRLAEGEENLSKAKNATKGVKTVSMIGATTMWPVTAVVLGVSNKKISEGEQMAAKGKEKIKAGEEQVKAGRLELQRGIQRLRLANKIRIACGISTIIFGFLLIALGFYWRRSLVIALKRSKT